MSGWIPDYDFANRLLIESISANVVDPLKFVDLGAGTGRVSRMLLEAFPAANIYLVDVSSNMLAEAKRQLSDFWQRCDFRVHDIFDLGLDVEPQSIDCVVSAFAICHAQGSDVYEKLYTQIYGWLKPGGYFVNYDHVLGDTAALTALNALGWARFMGKTQTQDAVEEAVVSTYQEDSPLSLKAHLKLLEYAGFRSVDVLYKRDIFAIYGAVK